MRTAVFGTSLSLATLILWGCANKTSSSDTADVAQFQVQLVALNNTVLKETTEQSSQLASQQKCSIDAGERLQLRAEPKRVQANTGNHFRITLLPEQQLKSPCALETGFVFTEHFRQEFVQVVASSPDSGSNTPQNHSGTPSEDSTLSENEFIWPTNSGVLVSGFGPRYGVLHEGIDIAVANGTPVLASANGQVLFSGWSNAGFGKLVRLGHANQIETRYAHNSELMEFASGKVVLKGETIARSGNTGKSLGPHVHFELRIKGQAVDPLIHLPRRPN